MDDSKTEPAGHTHADEQAASTFDPYSNAWMILLVLGRVLPQDLRGLLHDLDRIERIAFFWPDFEQAMRILLRCGLIEVEKGKFAVTKSGRATLKLHSTQHEEHLKIPNIIRAMSLAHPDAELPIEKADYDRAMDENRMNLECAMKFLDRLDAVENAFGGIPIERLVFAALLLLIGLAWLIISLETR